MKVTTREVGHVVFAALDSHLCMEQDNGELEGWTATTDRETETESVVLVSIGTRQAFHVTVREETAESWSARLDARCQAAARQRDHVGLASNE